MISTSADEVIELRVTDIAQLFHTLDPFPFRERDLDKEAEEYIVGWAWELAIDRPPEGALNPHTIWVVVILIMAIGAAGHVAVRVLGARFGLPIAGLASGFVSSTATIGAGRSGYKGA